MKGWGVRLSLVVLLAGLVATAPRAAGPGPAVPAAGATGPSGPSQTQSGTWEVVSSPTANDLWGVDMVSADEGWAVGQGGTMVRYRNGQWQTAPGQIVDMLHAVDMVSAGDGWAVGGGGEDTIYHYGGGSWQAVEPTGYWLNDVHMVTAYLGWAVGSGGTILKYSVGTWQASFLPTSDNLNAVDVFSSSSAWAVGDVIARYSGGGWQVFASPTGKRLRSVDIVSSTEGWAVGETGTILHYSGGQWQQVSSPTSQWLHAVHMVSADEGWAVGVGGTILHYSSGRWQSYPSPTGNALLDVTMVSADEGWAVGASGTILHYTTPEPPSAQFSGDPRSGPAPLAVQFSDESSGEISAWDWDFGDGANSSLQNPAHTYARPGKYRVSLMVTGPGGSDTETKVGYISVTGLAYAGQSFLPFVGPLPPGVPAVVIDEDDGRITTGDHVMMSLPFKNIGPQTISNAWVEIIGRESGENVPGIRIFDSQGGDWLLQHSVQLTPSSLDPGQIGWADVTIYVDNLDPELRTSREQGTSMQVRTFSGTWGTWTVAIDLEPILFAMSEHQALTEGSFLHTPDDFLMEQYAQYAAGADVHFWTDPDTPEMAVRNLVERVNGEFHGDETKKWPLYREPDVTLLTTRGGSIGVCRHIADLATGLLRSLGIPTRYVTSLWNSGNLGHAWVEVFLGGESWRHADPTWNEVFDKVTYEASAVCEVIEKVWADPHPLSAALYNICVPPCFQPPLQRLECLQGIDDWWSARSSDLGATECADDITSDYKASDVSRDRMAEPSAGSEELLVHLQGPTLVTHTVPFTLTANVVNSTTLPLETVTTTVALQEYADSTIPLFEADQAQQIRTDVAPSETVTLTWVITPLVTGSGLPLRVTAKGGGLLAVAQRPVVVKEPGTPPPLSMGLVREPGTLGPGQPLTLTAYVLDGHLEPITGTEAILTVTVSSMPTADYVETLNLTYCDSCGHYRQVLQLPAGAPVGAYWVDAVATHADHDPAQAVATFFVAPALTMTLEVTPAAVSQDEPMTVTARVYDRGAPVAGAGVEAVITTPGGAVTVPLVYNGAFYGRTLKPSDLGPNLGGGVQSGLWTVRATADSYGSEAVGDASVVVKHRVYLPLIWRGLP